MFDKPSKLERKRFDDRALTAHILRIASATQLEVRVKGERAATSNPTTESLAEIARRLIAGEISAAQVRYLDPDGWWSETYLRMPEGFRLIRMREGS